MPGRQQELRYGSEFKVQGFRVVGIGPETGNLPNREP
jgi:hypothetical protein